MKFFVALLVLTAALHGGAPVFAQNLEKPAEAVVAAPAFALRVGDLAPVLQLPRENGALFDSRLLLGQRAQFWLLEGDAPSLDGSAEVAASAKIADAAGVTCALIASNPDAATRYRWPAPFATLRDEKHALTANFPLPAFVAVDRAGWIRGLESLPTAQGDAHNLEVRYRLEKTGDPTPALAVGQPAPDFAFPDANGVWRRVSDLRGRKNLVLTFFPKCFTGRCKSHLSSLRDHFAAFRAAQTEVWAVSVDEAAGEHGQRAFAASLNLPFPLLPDVGRNLCLLYRSVDEPQAFSRRQSVIIDRNGIVRWIDTQVNAETHGIDVLARLAALGLIAAK